MDTCRLEALEQRCVLSGTYITDFGSDKSAAAVGDPLTLSTTAWAQLGVRAATYWLDVDNNHWWTPGVDRSWGDAWANPPFTTGVLHKTVVPDASWPSQARVMTDAVDTQGHWSGHPLEIQLPRVDRPRADSLTFTPQVAAMGEPVRLSASVFADRPVRAVSFFVDFNENRRWDPGVDEPLGDVFTPVPGSPSRYELTTVAAWDWGIDLGGPGQLQKYTRSMGAAVQTIDGVWSAEPVTADLTLAPRPVVTELRAAGSASTVQLTATIETHTPGGWYVVLPGAPNQPTGVQFFYDANRNGAYDAGTDVNLGVATSTSHTFAMNASAGSWWPFPRQYGAFVLDARPGVNQGPVTVAEHQSAVGLERARITSLRSIGPVQREFPKDPYWVEGEMLRLSVDAAAAQGGSAVRSISAFFDVNHNGRYDLGTDQFILEQNTSGSTAHVEFLFPTYGEGMVSVGVFAKDWTWNAGYVKVWNVLVTRPPKVTSPSASATNGGQGRQITVNLDAATQSGVKSVLAFVDANNNGRLDSGERSATSYHSTSGDSRSGHYRLTLNAVGLSGMYRVRLLLTNFYEAQTLTYVNVNV